MNKKYLHWLFESRKVMLAFVTLIYLFLIFAPVISGYEESDSMNRVTMSMNIAAILSVILAVVLPYLIFSYIHRKRSVDLYFSLPVSRHDQLITGCLFCLIISEGLFMTGTFLIWLMNFPNAGIRVGSFLLVNLWMLYALSAVILCCAFVNAVANNEFDAFVLLCSYAALPIAVSILLSNFSMIMIAGNPLIAFSGAGWLSPVYMTIYNAEMLISDGGSFNGIYVLILGAFILFSAIGLKNEFIGRKSERAEQISDGFLSYPFIINAYAVIILLVYAIVSVGNGLFQSSMVIWYVVLFAIYLIASFVYRRSFHISWKFLVCFAVEAACCFLIVTIGWKTRGFGIADNYVINEHDGIQYTYSGQVMRSDLGQAANTDGDYDDWVTIEVVVNIPQNEREEYDDVINLMEQYRKQQIDDFYTDKDDAFNGTLNVSDYTANDQTPDNKYTYSAFEPLSESDIKKLNAADSVTSVTIHDIYDDDYDDIPLEQFLKKREDTN